VLSGAQAGCKVGSAGAALAGFLAGFPSVRDNEAQGAAIGRNPPGPKSMMRDYQDHMKYDQSTQGHLNSDGL
jgi:hypothetical protein